MGSTCQCLYYKKKKGKESELFPLQINKFNQFHKNGLTILTAYRKYKIRKQFHLRKRIDFDSFLTLIKTFKSPNEIVENTHSKLKRFNLKCVFSTISLGDLNVFISVRKESKSIL